MNNAQNLFSLLEQVLNMDVGIDTTMSGNAAQSFNSLGTGNSASSSLNTTPENVEPPENFVSMIRFSGVPVLPPLLSSEKRAEMQSYKQLAVEREASKRDKNKTSSTLAPSKHSSTDLVTCHTASEIYADKLNILETSNLIKDSSLVTSSKDTSTDSVMFHLTHCLTSDKSADDLNELQSSDISKDSNSVTSSKGSCTDLVTGYMALDRSVDVLKPSASCKDITGDSVNCDITHIATESAAYDRIVLLNSDSSNDSSSLTVHKGYCTDLVTGHMISKISANDFRTVPQISNSTKDSSLVACQLSSDRLADDLVLQPSNVEKHQDMLNISNEICGTLDSVNRDRDSLSSNARSVNSLNFNRDRDGFSYALCNAQSDVSLNLNFDKDEDNLTDTLSNTRPNVSFDYNAAVNSSNPDDGTQLNGQKLYHPSTELVNSKPDVNESDEPLNSLLADSKRSDTFQSETNIDLRIGPFNSEIVIDERVDMLNSETFVNKSPESLDNVVNNSVSSSCSQLFVGQDSIYIGKTYVRDDCENTISKMPPCDCDITPRGSPEITERSCDENEVTKRSPDKIKVTENSPGEFEVIATSPKQNEVMERSHDENEVTERSTDENEVIQKLSDENKVTRSSDENEITIISSTEAECTETSSNEFIKRSNNEANQSSTSEVIQGSTNEVILRSHDEGSLVSHNEASQSSNEVIQRSEFSVDSGFDSVIPEDFRKFLDSPQSSLDTTADVGSSVEYSSIREVLGVESEPQVDNIVESIVRPYKEKLRIVLKGTSDAKTTIGSQINDTHGVFATKNSGEMAAVDAESLIVSSDTSSSTNQSDLITVLVVLPTADKNDSAQLLATHTYNSVLAGNVNINFTTTTSIMTATSSSDAMITSGSFKSNTYVHNLPSLSRKSETNESDERLPSLLVNSYLPGLPANSEIVNFAISDLGDAELSTSKSSDTTSIILNSISNSTSSSSSESLLYRVDLMYEENKSVNDAANSSGLNNNVMECSEIKCIAGSNEIKCSSDSIHDAREDVAEHLDQGQLSLVQVDDSTGSLVEKLEQEELGLASVDHSKLGRVEDADNECNVMYPLFEAKEDLVENAEQIDLAPLDEAKINLAENTDNSSLCPACEAREDLIENAEQINVVPFDDSRLDLANNAGSGFSLAPADDIVVLSVSECSKGLLPFCFKSSEIANKSSEIGDNLQLAMPLENVSIDASTEITSSLDKLDKDNDTVLEANSGNFVPEINIICESTAGSLMLQTETKSETELNTNCEVTGYSLMQQCATKFSDNKIKIENTFALDGKNKSNVSVPDSEASYSSIIHQNNEDKVSDLQNDSCASDLMEEKLPLRTMSYTVLEPKIFKDTSGFLVFAGDKGSQDRIESSFENNSVAEIKSGEDCQTDNLSSSESRESLDFEDGTGCVDSTGSTTGIMYSYIDSEAKGQTSGIMYSSMNEVRGLASGIMDTSMEADSTNSTGFYEVDKELNKSPSFKSSPFRLGSQLNDAYSLFSTKNLKVAALDAENLIASSGTSSSTDQSDLITVQAVLPAVDKNDSTQLLTTLPSDGEEFLNDDGNSRSGKLSSDYQEPSTYDSSSNNTVQVFEYNTTKTNNKKEVDPKLPNRVRRDSYTLEHPVILHADQCKGDSQDVIGSQKTGSSEMYATGPLQKTNSSICTVKEALPDLGHGDASVLQNNADMQAQKTQILRNLNRKNVPRSPELEQSFERVKDVHISSETWPSFEGVKDNVIGSQEMEESFEEARERWKMQRSYSVTSSIEGLGLDRMGRNRVYGDQGNVNAGRNVNTQRNGNQGNVIASSECNVNQGHVNQCYVRQGSVEQCYVKQGGVGEGSVNQGYVNQDFVKLGQVEKGNVNQGYLRQHSVDSSYVNDNNVNKTAGSNVNQDSSYQYNVNQHNINQQNVNQDSLNQCNVNPAGENINNVSTTDKINVNVSQNDVNPNCEEGNKRADNLFNSEIEISDDLLNAQLTESEDFGKMLQMQRYLNEVSNSSGSTEQEQETMSNGNSHFFSKQGYKEQNEFLNTRVFYNGVLDDSNFEGHNNNQNGNSILGSTDREIPSGIFDNEQYSNNTNGNSIMENTGRKIPVGTSDSKSNLEQCTNETNGNSITESSNREIPVGIFDSQSGEMDSGTKVVELMNSGSSRTEEKLIRAFSREGMQSLDEESLLKWHTEQFEQRKKELIAEHQRKMLELLAEQERQQGLLQKELLMMGSLNSTLSEFSLAGQREGILSSVQHESVLSLRGQHEGVFSMQPSSLATSDLSSMLQQGHATSDLSSKQQASNMLPRSKDIAVVSNMSDNSTLSDCYIEDSNASFHFVDKSLNGDSSISTNTEDTFQATLSSQNSESFHRDTSSQSNSDGRFEKNLSLQDKHFVSGLPEDKISKSFGQKIVVHMPSVSFQDSDKQTNLVKPSLPVPLNLAQLQQNEMQNYNNLHLMDEGNNKSFDLETAESSLVDSSYVEEEGFNSRSDAIGQDPSSRMEWKSPIGHNTKQWSEYASFQSPIGQNSYNRNAWTSPIGRHANDSGLDRRITESPAVLRHNSSTDGRITSGGRPYPTFDLSARLEIMNSPDGSSGGSMRRKRMVLMEGEGRREVIGGAKEEGRVLYSVTDKDLPDFVHYGMVRLTALVRGFLTRQLIKSTRVQQIIQTIKDTAEFALTLQLDGEESGVVSQRSSGQLSLQDQKLVSRVLAQLNAAMYDIHEIFFEISVSERMYLISQSRAARQENLFKSRDSQSRRNKEKRVSVATLKFLERKKQVAGTNLHPESGSLGARSKSSRLCYPAENRSCKVGGSTGEDHERNKIGQGENKSKLGQVEVRSKLGHGESKSKPGQGERIKLGQGHEGNRLSHQGRGAVSRTQEKRGGVKKPESPRKHRQQLVTKHVTVRPAAKVLSTNHPSTLPILRKVVRMSDRRSSSSSSTSCLSTGSHGPTSHDRQDIRRTHRNTAGLKNKLNESPISSRKTQRPSQRSSLENSVNESPISRKKTQKSSRQVAAKISNKSVPFCGTRTITLSGGLDTVAYSRDYSVLNSTDYMLNGNAMLGKYSVLAKNLDDHLVPGQHSDGNIASGGSDMVMGLNSGGNLASGGSNIIIGQNSVSARDFIAGENFESSQNLESYLNSSRKLTTDTIRYNGDGGSVSSSGSGVGVSNIGTSFPSYKCSSTSYTPPMTRRSLKFSNAEQSTDKTNTSIASRNSIDNSTSSSNHMELNNDAFRGVRAPCGTENDIFGLSRNDSVTNSTMLHSPLGSTRMPYDIDINRSASRGPGGAVNIGTCVGKTNAGISNVGISSGGIFNAGISTNVGFPNKRSSSSQSNIEKAQGAKIYLYNPQIGLEDEYWNRNENDGALFDGFGMSTASDTTERGWQPYCDDRISASGSFNRPFPGQDIALMNIPNYSANSPVVGTCRGVGAKHCLDIVSLSPTKQNSGFVGTNNNAKASLAGANSTAAVNEDIFSPVRLNSRYTGANNSVTKATLASAKSAAAVHSGYVGLNSNVAKGSFAGTNSAGAVNKTVVNKNAKRNLANQIASPTKGNTITVAVKGGDIVVKKKT